MRETRTAQTSIFESYAQHEQGVLLKHLSDVLDTHPQIIGLLKKDLIGQSCVDVGRKGLSVDSVFRCLLLKQKYRLSYDELSFRLLDSPTLQSFARLRPEAIPSRSSLQANIKRIRAQTLECVYKLITVQWQEQGDIDLSAVRVDSTVVKSNIAPPSDSQLLNAGIRVMSRYMAKCCAHTGVKLTFKDYRKASRKLSSAIFYAKKAEKDALYLKLLSVADKVMGQVERACDKVRGRCSSLEQADKWLGDITHYYGLTQRVIEQAKRRVIGKEKVPASEKIVSLFEEHTDIIIKGAREVEYGHKVNLASDPQGVLTSVMIEDGNPADLERYLPVVHEHKILYGCYPHTVVADGGYATVDNAQVAKELGIKRRVFHKKKGITLALMGVKKKTYETLRDFRAGIEGNISELKRVFGLGKALWKTHEGFKAYVWSSVLCYNLTRMARIRSG